MKFIFVEKGEYGIYTLEKAEKEIERIKEQNALKKIMSYIGRLSMRIPNSPEKWEKIKGCEIEVYELKPFPYRLGCYKHKSFILIVHVWRVQKNRSSEKAANIKKACSIAQEVKNEFEKFIGSV